MTTPLPAPLLLLFVDFVLSFFSLLLLRSADDRSLDDFSDEDDDDLLLARPLGALLLATVVVDAAAVLADLLLLLVTFVSGECLGFDIFWMGEPNSDSNLLVGLGSSGFDLCFLPTALLVINWLRIFVVASSFGWPGRTEVKRKKMSFSKWNSNPLD